MGSLSSSTVGINGMEGVRKIKNGHSSAIVMLSALILFSPLVLLQTTLVQGQTYCYDGLLPCVQDAVCDPSTDTCECASGFHGNGRVACRDSTRCVCTALADPNFSLFDPQSGPQTLRANLPCSVTLVGQFITTGLPTCLLSSIYAHPETRGSGMAANLRVFVKELEVTMVLPAVQFTVDVNGTTVISGDSEVVSALNSDNFHTATVANCGDLQVGYNTTYAGAYVDSAAGTYNPAGLCGNCDDTSDENPGSSNTTNLAYFLKFLAPAVDQKGAFSTECGQIQAITSTLCSDADLDLAADVCGRYLSDFGVCLITDTSAVDVPDFATLLTAKVLPCITNICLTGSATAQCAALTAEETASCLVGQAPSSC